MLTGISWETKAEFRMLNTEVEWDGVTQGWGGPQLTDRNELKGFGCINSPGDAHL